ncbi:hypothetical protein D3C75_872910 [compost metagenome]
MENLMRILSYFQLTCTTEDLKRDAISRANVLGLIADAISEMMGYDTTVMDDVALMNHYQKLAAFCEAKCLLNDFETLDQPGLESQTDVPGGLLVGDEDEAFDRTVDQALVAVLMEYAEYNGRAAIQGVRGATPIQYLRIYYDETYVPKEVAHAFLGVWHFKGDLIERMEEYESWDHPRKPKA